MPISRFDEVPEQPLIHTYVPLPFEDIMNDVHSRQHEYDTNRAAADEANNFLKVKALDPDIDRRNQLLQGYQDQMKSALDNAKGDYGSLGEFLSSHTNKIKSDLAYGQLGAIHNNALAHEQYLKGLDDQYKKGDIGLDKRNALSQISLNTFANQGGTFHQGGGRYNQYNGVDAAKDLDLVDLGNKVAKEMPSHIVAKAGAYKDPNTGVWYKDSKKTEKLTGQEIFNVVKPYLLQHPGVKDYLNQEHFLDTYGQTDFSPKTPEEASQYESIRKQYPGVSDADIYKHFYIDNRLNHAANVTSDIYDKDNILERHRDIAFDPYDYYLKKKAASEAQPQLSDIGSSNIEQIDNPNYKNALGGLNVEGNKITTPSYSKVVNGKSIPVTEQEYKNAKQVELTNIGEHIPNTGMPRYSANLKKEVDYQDLYKNPDLKDIIDTEYQRQTGKSPSATNRPSNEFIRGTLLDYKKAMDNNAKLNPDQYNNDSEQMTKNGKILEAQLQSSEIIPLDSSAKDLAKQSGGTLDYQQLTEKGWQVQDVKSSGVVYGTGMKNSAGQELPIADRAVISLKKGDETKNISVLMRTPENSVQNSPDAQIVQNIAKVKQSAHNGEVRLGVNLKAKVSYSYKGGVAQPHVIYVDNNNNPLSKDQLSKGGLTKKSADGREIPLGLDDIQKSLHEEINHKLQKVGYGHRSVATNKTTDLETEID